MTKPGGSKVAVVTDKVASVGIDKISPEAIEELKKMPGVDVHYEETPEGKKTVEIDVNTLEINKK